MLLGAWLRASMAASLILATAAEAQVEAAASRAEIAITPTMLPVDGFALVHDPLSARVLVVREGASHAAVAVVDQTSMGADVVEAIKAIVSRDTETSSDAVLVVASHTFSAPHMFTSSHLPPGVTMSADEAHRAQAYHDAVLSAVDQAARAAAGSLAPVEVTWANGVSDVNISRNMPTADGWWLGANPSGNSDKDVGILAFDAAGGRPLAILVDYAVQSSVMDHAVGTAGKGVTADLGGTAMRHLEQQFGPRSVAMFLTGAAGDQAPGYVARQNRYDRDGRFETVDIGDKGYDLVGAQGGRLSEDVARAMRDAKPVPRISPLRVRDASVTLDTQARPTDLRQIKPTRSYVFQAAGKAEAPFVVMQIGDVAVVGVQAELSAATGQAIRQRSPFAHTMVVTMVNGAAKYMPEAEGYRRITYEAMNSAYAQGAAERFTDAIVEVLRQMHDDPVRSSGRK